MPVTSALQVFLWLVCYFASQNEAGIVLQTFLGASSIPLVGALLRFAESEAGIVLQTFLGVSSIPLVGVQRGVFSIRQHLNNWRDSILR